MKAFIFCLLFIFNSTCFAHAWQARVVSVADGDTITVEPVVGGERVKVRLHGIDAPEKKQAGGEAARGFVFDAALYKNVEISEQGKPDRYGRAIAIVYLPSGQSLQAELLKNGHAWVYPRYCKKCTDWEALQDAARKNKRGLWGDENAVPPWEWRAVNKRW